jgi:N-acetylmuramoyl-L-alanine amidase
LNDFAPPGKLRGVKFISVLLAGLCFFLARPSRAVVLNGHDYRSLAGWAAENKFREVNDGRRDRLTLTNGAAQRLAFEKNSATAEINGIKVVLSFPVALDKTGIFLIARFDLAKTIEPLVFSPPVVAKKISTICLDPGHGGKDAGFRVGKVFPRSEKTYTLALAQELRKQLQAAGFKVILTREKDVYPALAARPDLANRAGADLFVSLHFNAFPRDPSAVSGPETYCITPVGAASSNAQGVGAGSSAAPANRVENKSLLLAYQVQRALVKNLGATDRSVRRARFEVLRGAVMPAILIEGGYLSHPVEGKKIVDANYRKQMAAALVKGILNYQKLTAPPTPPKKNQ